MIFDMVMAYVHFLMGINIKENGLKERNMDVDWKSFPMDIVTMEYSNMTELLDHRLSKFMYSIAFLV